MYGVEPQVVWTAVSIFVGLLFMAIAVMWMGLKTYSESLAKTNELLAETNELLVETNELLVEMNKTLSELKTDWAKSFAEIRDDLKTVNTRGDGYLDSHMDKRMDGLEGQVRDLKGEVRGINEFLRRDSVKDTEDDKKS